MYDNSVVSALLNHFKIYMGDPLKSDQIIVSNLHTKNHHY